MTFSSIRGLNGSSITFHFARSCPGPNGDRKLATALYLKVTSWNQLDDTGYCMVRSRAIARGVELAKLPE